MHDQAHHPPARPARSTENIAKPRVSVRRPVSPSGDQPEATVHRKDDGGVAAEPPAGPPPIVARILRACSACKRDDEEQRSKTLALSQPGDPLEKEADQVAERVMRAADPGIRVSRAHDDEEGLLARLEAPGVPSTGATSMVRDTLRSSGQPLSRATRAFMEPRFGRDFGDVRVHTDAQASRSAEAVSALAYTVGSNIVFRSGQYAPQAPAGARLLAHELAHVAQQAPGTPIQRATAAEHDAADKGAADSGTAMAGAKPAAAGFIVEDDETTPLDPKQMRKTAFLASLRPRVEEAVDEGYSSVVDRITGRAAVAARFAMYSAQSAKSLEQTLRREVGGAGSAAGYMGAVVARVRAEVTADEEKDLEERNHNIFFKGREGGPRAPDDPRTVRASLGQGGQPLPSGVRAGMESAMGQDFSGVRVHTGATAAKVSSGLNARALTVGQDIAFAAGEYQPGTPIGDALIAHELAHVVQQGNSRHAAVAPKSESAHDEPLEAAADEAAMGAVLSMWGGIKAGALGLARTLGAGLKSGLKLQRCDDRLDKIKQERKERAEKEQKKYDDRRERAGKMGEAVGEKMKKINDSQKENIDSTERGVWYEVQLRGTSRWRDEYADGFTRAPNLTKIGRYTWVLNGGSASKAVVAWLAGFTVADCASTMTAAQYNALIGVLGPEKFDELFSGPQPSRGPLIISQSIPPGLQYYLETPPDDDKLKVGDRVYIANHPMYALRHPLGPWQGEHAVVTKAPEAGEPLYSGFGVVPRKESDHLAEARQAYNDPPTEEEQKIIKARMTTSKGRKAYKEVPKELGTEAQMKALNGYWDPFREVYHPRAGVQKGSSHTRFNKDRVMEDIPKPSK